MMFLFFFRMSAHLINGMIGLGPLGHGMIYYFSYYKGQISKFVREQSLFSGIFVFLFHLKTN